ncbi:hypothetical protein SeseC_01541 [Streptococcus equi subsp. zooepidemicus ATCC 35246]|nr:hypothetical protein SeseC_01541 [Streptococcus equi subsp. zooepidemicus ATCC 35246]
MFYQFIHAIILPKIQPFDVKTDLLATSSKLRLPLKDLL